MAGTQDEQEKALIEALRGVLCQIAEPTAVLRAILERAVSLTSADRGLLVEVSEQGEPQDQVLHRFEPRHLEGQAGLFSRQLIARVLGSGREIVLHNALDDSFFSGVESIQAMRALSILCVPIRAGERIAAVIQLQKRQPRHFTPEHVEMVQSLGEVAGPVLEVLKAGRQTMQERDRLRLSESRLRVEAEESRRQLASDWSFGRFVGRSAPVRELEVMLHKAAATDFPVLVQGETGTGKSIVARVLHYAGPRSKGPLVTIFCPSLERSLVEPELFGHTRGAFTGAVSDRAGKIQAAEHGTLFFDEIGELPLEIQPKLLRLLQEKTYERVGDPRERQADVRVIAATNRDLALEVREGRFRRDLYERLRFIPVVVPPLRERRDDIPLLLRHCLDLTESGRWITIEPTAEVYLEQLDFSWPGNVRHIEQLAARLTMERPEKPVGVEWIARLLAAEPEDGNGDGGGRPADGRRALESGLPRLLEDAEKRWLEEAIRLYPTSTRAGLAARLKISESALYKKLRQYGIGE